MALNKKPYKGCRDFFPSQMRERDYIFGKMRSAAESFAYEAYDGPMLEEVDLYKAKSGEELINDQIYSFFNISFCKIVHIASNQNRGVFIE